MNWQKRDFWKLIYVREEEESEEVVAFPLDDMLDCIDTFRTILFHNTCDETFKELNFMPNSFTKISQNKWACQTTIKNYFK